MLVSAEITHHNHSIITCLCHLYIWVLFFAHILFVVNRTFSAMPAEWLQQDQSYAIYYTVLFMQARVLLGRY